MSRCIVGSVESLSNRRTARTFVVIFSRLRTASGHVYRCFDFPQGELRDVPLAAVTLYCGWCKRPFAEHANAQCLFASTKFRAYTVQAELMGQRYAEVSKSYPHLIPNLERTPF